MSYKQYKNRNTQGIPHNKKEKNNNKKKRQDKEKRKRKDERDISETQKNMLITKKHFLTKLTFAEIQESICCSYDVR